MEKLHTLLFRISRLSVWVFGAGYLLIALATTLDVILRNTFSMGVPGVYEISGYIFAIATTWGFSFVLFERAHVRIDVAYMRFGNRLRALADRAWITLEDTIFFGATARTTLQTPLWIPQSFWLAGMAYFLLCIVFLAVYAVLLILRGRTADVASIAGIPHVTAQIESEAP